MFFQTINLSDKSPRTIIKIDIVIIKIVPTIKINWREIFNRERQREQNIIIYRNIIASLSIWLIMNKIIIPFFKKITAHYIFSIFVYRYMMHSCFSIRFFFVFKPQFKIKKSWVLSLINIIARFYSIFLHGINITVINII